MLCKILKSSIILQYFFDSLFNSVSDAEVIVIHSAFSKLKVFGFSPESFCAQLVQNQRLTTIFPAFSWRIVSPDFPVFDPLITPSHVGVLPECFRRNYADFRSLHGTHSYAGRGPLTEELFRSHYRSKTPVDDFSPVRKALSYKTKIILLNCDLSVCTPIHYYEEKYCPELALEDNIFHIKIKNLDHSFCFQSMRRHTKTKRNFQEHFSPLSELGAVTTLRFVENNYCHVIDYCKFDDYFNEVFFSKPCATLTN